MVVDAFLFSANYITTDKKLTG